MKENILENIRLLINTAKKSVNRQIDSTMTLTYFLVGRYIVEDEQEGEERAKYAKSTLKFLSENLTKEFGKGFSEDNLENMRKFFIAYKDNRQVVGILDFMLKSEKSSRILENNITQKKFENPFVLFCKNTG